jgi:hypothetical protein
MTFRVGQKVVCVNAKPTSDSFWNYAVTPPIEGKVYTVSKSNFLNREGVEAIEIAEIKNPYGFGFKALRFRPVVERKANISIFKRILNSVNQDVDA